MEGTIKVTIDERGRAKVSEVLDGAPAGIDGSAQAREWDIGAHQVAQHIPMFSGRLSRGDVDALRDAAREAEKKRERGER